MAAVARYNEIRIGRGDSRSPLPRTQLTFSTYCPNTLVRRGFVGRRSPKSSKGARCSQEPMGAGEIALIFRPPAAGRSFESGDEMARPSSRWPCDALRDGDPLWTRR